MIRIGIDPDLTKSGVATVVNGEIVTLKSMGFSELIEFVISKSHLPYAVLLEDVDNKKPVFPKRLRQSAKGQNPLLAYVGHAPSQSGSNAKVNMSIAEDLGKVKATARLIKEVLEDKGIKVTLVKPLRGPIKKAKDSSVYFNKITGWTGRSNADTRDAALIAMFGQGE
ncbi:MULTISPECIES: hypothetical protein [unclassified Shewanella]|uniref:hypothetical protein n=1 Tax=unclassified Shewanella TaxID=196818 RepID=UPI00156A17BA|nr:MULTISPECIES: hypothetical protein [unclassified Shewanella]MCU8008480.1 hypothetical protein [Shewanella sp. SM87]